MKKSKPYEEFYSVKAIREALLWMLGVMVAMRLTGGVGFIIVPMMAFVALARRNTQKLLFWIMVTASVLCMNGMVVPRGIVFAVAQRAMMVVLGMILLTKCFVSSANSKFLTPFLLLLPYLFYMIIPSATGFWPLVSFLKLFLFLIIFFAYYGAVSNVINDQRMDMRLFRSQFLAVAMLFILGSVAVIPFPSISIMSSMYSEGLTSLFQGLTAHSQALGPMISTLSVFLFADLLFSIRRPDKLYILMLLCAPILIYKTQSRTGMGAFLIGMMFVTMLFMKDRTARWTWKTKVIRALLTFFIVVILAAVSSGGLGKQVEKFMLKGAADKAELSVENVTSSRQALIEESFENFKEKPIFGNGFQVSRMMMGSKADSLMSIMSAPIEKGVWVYAVLEEGGVCGMLFFLAFIVSAIIQLTLRKAYIGASSLFTFIVCNFGEFGFFSMSYVGGFVWVFIFVGVGMDILRIRKSAQDKALSVASAVSQDNPMIGNNPPLGGNRFSKIKEAR